MLPNLAPTTHEVTSSLPFLISSIGNNLLVDCIATKILYTLLLRTIPCSSWS